MRSAKIILLGFISLTALALNAKGLKTAKDVIEELEKKYTSVTDFQAEFEQIEASELLKKEKKSFGVIYSLPEGKIFWHTQKPYEHKVISDGKKIWMVDVTNDQVMTETWGMLDSQAKIALLFLRREGKLNKIFHSSLKEDNEKYRLTLTPRKKMNLNKIMIDVDRKDVFFNQLIFYFPLKRVTTLKLKNIKLNQDLLGKHVKNTLDKNISINFEYLKR